MRMKQGGVFLLLLGVCCLSGSELHEAAITEKPSLTKSLNALDQPQLCPSDVHAVLREMSAALAEHRLRIEQLQTENQGQAAKLREIEKKTNEVDSLKQQQQVRQVAFSASLLASGHGFIGPFTTETPLAFRHVVTNIGNAYNPNTGFFVAPVTGAYHFEFHVGTHGDSAASGAVLMMDGKHICVAYEEQTSGYGRSSNGATLLLEVGNVVYLNLVPKTRIFDNENHHSSFSGHLLFTM